MKLNIDRTKLRKEEIDTDILLNKISTGNAILFTGAGFSIGAKNINDESPPLANNLSTKICELGGFDIDEDLRFTSGYYLDLYDESKLISILKENYTIKDVSQHQIDICNVNWRRSYTTNYDKSIEVASRKCNKVVECIDLSFSVQEYYKRKNLCVHLNGSLDSLTGESLENSFKLSTSSYISADSFLNSSWFPHFKRDLERSSANIFVGYSMYDIEIQKLLIENEDLKDRTYFITRENPDHRTTYTLSKFGHIVPIGVEGFAELLRKNKELFVEKNESEYQMQALSLFKISDNSIEPTDTNVETMLMYGDIKNHLVDNTVLGSPVRPYMIKRDILDQVLGFINTNSNIIIHSEFGNGKSILLQQLKPYLSVNSIDAYEVVDSDADLIEDIDYLASKSHKCVIIIDSYEEHLEELLQHYSSTLPSNIQIIASARTSEHERFRPKLKEIQFSYNEINIDFLNNNEPLDFVKIIDNVGLWGDKAALSRERKIAYLEFENNLQISLALLALFNAPQIKSRINKLLISLLKNQKFKDTIFAISLLEVLDIETNFSQIIDVARNNSIYSSDILNNTEFKQLFKVDGNKVISKSSLFCLSLIKNHFTATYTIDQLHNIASKFNSYGSKDYKQERIFKSCLKFSFVERLLPDTNKKGNLRNYYEKLKNFVPWLINDPHYWLQYGMANITFSEFSRAQGYFDQAYALARKKDNYHTSNIDTQQARLYILVDIHAHNSDYNNFSKAHSMLNKLDDDVYKFRQVQKYRDYYESCFDSLSKGNKVKFEHACKGMLKAIDIAEGYGDINSTSQKPIFHAKNSLELIVDSISKSRL